MLRVEGYDRKLRHDWELARWQVWQLLGPNYKKGQAPKTPQDFCRFAWEQTSDAEINEAYNRSRITNEETEILNRLFPKTDI